ncbi:ESPR-type extended signal peptide-containing protein [Burkholderia ubonensis]|uniref:ESPR-type extended signal peptide-containing protein n=1 Tax=Burkholderia ubonensis TaxID=101571 RepID=UPI0039F4C0CD
MNKSHWTMWNGAFGAWVAEAELADARGKRKRSAMSGVLAVSIVTLVDTQL